MKSKVYIPFLFFLLSISLSACVTNKTTYVITTSGDSEVIQITNVPNIWLL